MGCAGTPVARLAFGHVVFRFATLPPCRRARGHERGPAPDDGGRARRVPRPLRGARREPPRGLKARRAPRASAPRPRAPRRRRRATRAARGRARSSRSSTATAAATSSTSRPRPAFGPNLAQLVADVGRGRARTTLPIERAVAAAYLLTDAQSHAQRHATSGTTAVSVLLRRDGRDGGVTLYAARRRLRAVMVHARARTAGR